MSKKVEQFLQAQENEKDRLSRTTKPSSVASQDPNFRTTDTLEDCARSVQEFVELASAELVPQQGSSKSSDKLSRAGSQRTQSRAVDTWLRTLGDNRMYDRATSQYPRSRPEVLLEEANEEDTPNDSGMNSNAPLSTSGGPTNRAPPSQIGRTNRQRRSASESGQSKSPSLANSHSRSGQFFSTQSQAGPVPSAPCTDTDDRTPDSVPDRGSVGSGYQGSTHFNAHDNAPADIGHGQDIPERPQEREDDRHYPDNGNVTDEDHSIAEHETTIPEFDENAADVRNDDSEPNIRLEAVQSQVIQHQFHAAKLKIDTNQHAEAEALLRQVVRRSKELHGDNYDWKDETEDMLARACFGQNKLTEAEGIIRTALADRRREEKKEKELDAMHSLAEVYLAKVDLHRADLYAQNAVNGKIGLFGKDHPSVHRSVAILVKIFEAKNDAPGIEGFERFLPKDYLHPQRQELEQLGTMTPEDAAGRVGVDLLKDLLPAESHEHWAEIRENVRSRKKGISGWGKGYTLLHAITEYGNEEAIRFLVGKEPAVDAKDRKGRTPLYLAARRNETIVRYFVEAGADINSPARNRKTPLMVAAEKSKPEIVKLLVDKHAEVNAMDELQWTALHYAAMFGSEEVTKILLQSSAEINRQGANKRTPLHCAATRGHLPVVRVLVASGAKINAKSADQKKPTPLDMAKRKCHEDIVLYLRRNMEGSLAVIRSRMSSLTGGTLVRLIGLFISYILAQRLFCINQRFIHTFCTQCHCLHSVVPITSTESSRVSGFVRNDRIGLN